VNVRAEPALHQRKKLFLFIGLEMQPLTQLKKWNTSGPRGIASQYSTPSCPLLSRKSVEMTDRFSPSQFSMRDHRSFRSHWRSYWSSKSPSSRRSLRQFPSICQVCSSPSEREFQPYVIRWIRSSLLSAPTPDEKVSGSELSDLRNRLPIRWTSHM
jgi:hypothetical protein